MVCRRVFTSDAKQTFETYAWLVNTVRRLSLDGRPRNDWFLSRDSRYDEYSSDPFGGFAANIEAQLPG